MASTASVKAQPAGGEPRDEIKAVPVRHWGRWIAAAIALLIVASLVRSAITNDRFEWDVVGQYLFDRRVLEGVLLTLELTLLAMLIGIALMVSGLSSDDGLPSVGLGAFVVFIGAAILGPTIARPISGVLGWPIRAMLHRSPYCCTSSSESATSRCRNLAT